MTEEYLNAKDIADRLGVTRAAVSNWVKRFPAGSIDPFPEPDVYVGNVPGWKPERLNEILRWLKRP